MTLSRLTKATVLTPCTEAVESLRLWRKIVTIFRVTIFPFVYHRHHHHHNSHQPFSSPPPPLSLSLSQLVNMLTQICVTTDERGNYTDRMPLHYAFFLLNEGGRKGRMTTLATSIFSLALRMNFPSLNNESVQTE